MTSHFEQIERIARLLVRKRMRVISGSERAELERWAGRSPAHGELVRKWGKRDYLTRDFREYAATDPADPLAQIKQAIGNGLREVCLPSPKETRESHGRKNTLLGRVTTWLGRGAGKGTGKARRRAGMLVVCLSSAVVLILVSTYVSDLPGPRKTISIPMITAYVPALVLDDGSRIELANSTLVLDNGAVEIRRHGGAREIVRPEAAAGGEPTYMTIHIPRGHTYRLTLEEGTRVWLNAQSRLRYPASFGVGAREVELEGEACFLVAPDASRPFRVAVGDSQTVEVIGTEFNIRAYAEEGAVYTTLLDGSVEVGTERERIILNPGSQSVLAGGILSVRPVDAAKAAGWREGSFIAEKEPLHGIMTMLARWYDFHVSYEDEAARDIIFDCEVPRYGELGRVLDLLELTGEVGFEVEGNRVTVKGKNVL